MSSIKILKSLLGLTGCGARDAIEDFGEYQVGSVVNPIKNVANMPDPRFDGSKSNFELVEEFRQQAKDEGAWDDVIHQLPQNIESVSDIDGNPHSLARCEYMPELNVGGVDVGFGSPGTRLRISRAIENMPLESKKRVINHELGHCLYQEDDKYDPADKDDLMYGYAPATVFPVKDRDEAIRQNIRAKQWNEDNKSKIKDIMKNFFARHKK